MRLIGRLWVAYRQPLWLKILPLQDDSFRGFDACLQLVYRLLNLPYPTEYLSFHVIKYVYCVKVGLYLGFVRRSGVFEASYFFLIRLY